MKVRVKDLNTLEKIGELVQYKDYFEIKVNDYFYNSDIELTLPISRIIEVQEKDNLLYWGFGGYGKWYLSRSIVDLVQE